MKTHRFESEVWLPLAPADLFPFFADAFNLEEITPPQLRFQVLTPPPIRMEVGTFIDYRLRLRGIPIRWRTRIAAWEPPVRFVDEQVRGPYRVWIHEHRFEASDGGTRMVDRVDYAVPGGALGDRLVLPVVRREVEGIFRYRRERLLERFGRE